MTTSSLGRRRRPRRCAPSTATTAGHVSRDTVGDSKHPAQRRPRPTTPGPLRRSSSIASTDTSNRCGRPRPAVGRHDGRQLRGDEERATARGASVPLATSVGHPFMPSHAAGAAGSSEHRSTLSLAKWRTRDAESSRPTPAPTTASWSSSPAHARGARCSTRRGPTSPKTTPRRSERSSTEDRTAPATTFTAHRWIIVGRVAMERRPTRSRRRENRRDEPGVTERRQLEGPLQDDRGPRRAMPGARFLTRSSFATSRWTTTTMSEPDGSDTLDLHSTTIARRSTRHPP